MRLPVGPTVATSPGDDLEPYSVTRPGASDRRELDALMAVSRAVAAGGALADLLDVVAEQAARVVGARSSSILLLREKQLFRLGGSYNLRPSYCSYLESAPIARGRGPSGLVLLHGQPVLIEDAQRDPRLGVASVAPKEARREGYESMASVPLQGATELLGVLHVYRAHRGRWPQRQVELLTYFAQHAATAIHTATLLERQNRQLGALEQLVAGLRYQTHEYANRLHAIRGLLAVGEYTELERFVADLEDRHHRSFEAVVSRIHNSAVAGLLLAHISVAQQRGIDLQLDRRSRLTTLPTRLADSEAITILGNLLQNAFDAVASYERSRRRVSVYVGASLHHTTFRVRDWGVGLASETETEIFEPGHTTKLDHAGIGLTLVASATQAARGAITIRHHPTGTTMKVTIPNG